MIYGPAIVSLKVLANPYPTIEGFHDGTREDYMRFMRLVSGMCREIGTMKIIQAGAPFNYSPETITASDATKRSIKFSVTTGTAVEWRLTSTYSWIKLTSSTSSLEQSSDFTHTGSNDQYVMLSENTSTSSRTGYLTVKFPEIDKEFSIAVTQPKASGMTVSPSRSWNIDARTNQKSFTTSSRLTSATSNQSWLRTRTDSNRQVTLTALANVTGKYRSAFVTLRASDGSLADIAVGQAGQTGNLVYAALGDSYTAGSGAIKSILNTNNDSSDPKGACARTKSSYPRVLADSQWLRLDDTDFKACNGDRLADVVGTSYTAGLTSRQHSSSALQTQILSSKTDVVTLTMGGNNTNFYEIAFGCFFTPSSCTTKLANDTSDVKKHGWNGLSTGIAAAIRRVLATAPNASVFVVDYPNPISPTATKVCLRPEGPGEDTYSVQQLREYVNNLNTSVKTAVRDVDDPRVTLVEMNGSGSGFPQHGVCESPRWINAVTLPFDASLHPTIEGNAEMARLIGLKMVSG